MPHPALKRGFTIWIDIRICEIETVCPQLVQLLCAFCTTEVAKNMYLGCYKKGRNYHNITLNISHSIICSYDCTVGPTVSIFASSFSVILFTKLWSFRSHLELVPCCFCTIFGKGPNMLQTNFGRAIPLPQ